MYALLIILILIAAILLTLIVLVQNSKGGGLAAGFQSSNQIMGVRKTTDFLEKATWTLATAMVLLCIVTVGMKSNNKAEVVQDSEIKEQSLELNKQNPNMATPNFSEQAAKQQQQQQNAKPAPAQPEKK